MPESEETDGHLITARGERRSDRPLDINPREIFGGSDSRPETVVPAMKRRNRDARSNAGVGPGRSTSAERRPTTDRSADGTNGATRIDLALVCCAIGAALVAIPLLAGYVFVSGAVPSPDSTAFDALGAVVMAPGLVMGTAVLWLCARSDPD